jgi:hypothetical protein
MRAMEGTVDLGMFLDILGVPGCVLLRESSGVWNMNILLFIPILARGVRGVGILKLLNNVFLKGDIVSVGRVRAGVFEAEDGSCMIYTMNIFYCADNRHECTRLWRGF